ncbi:uncharacterized protein LOC130933366 isoform X2 [Arachis stenosperma]|uniref:uncharacterized protein LOC130933366 isoform X2 n=1 Tax=Arachis stenosperma TaxID=217475 RepID=UPI0025AC9F0E|nr:uncharacterized protein LOC130933366 isoform X2 [Arachis stenosperma]
MGAEEREGRPAPFLLLLPLEILLPLLENSVGQCCRLRWLLGCRRTSLETGAVLLQLFFLHFESLWLLKKQFGAKVTAALLCYFRVRIRIYLWRLKLFLLLREQVEPRFWLP